MRAAEQSGAPITIAAIGDIMLDRTVGERYRRDPDAFLLKDFAALFRGHDIVLANLENPVSTRGVRDARQDPNVAFRAHPDTLTVLKNLGVTAVTIANNHMLDYGPTALADTVDALDAAGIPHVGAGRTYEEANRPLILTVKGQRIGFVGRVLIYSASTARAGRQRAGVADYRLSRILRQIRELRQSCTAVFVTLHWGLEYSFYPLRHLQQQARKMIDAGATLILGHGPHYVQGIERYKDGVIAYSVGNFIFDEPFRFANQGIVFSAAVRGTKVESFAIHPFEITDGVPRLSDSPAARRLKRFALNLSELYARKKEAFWQNVSNDYLRDIVRRVVGTRATKFLFVPPWSFYLHVGLRNYFRKFTRLAQRL